MMTMNNKKLVFVKPISNNNSYYEYDFIFSDTPENVWGPDWDFEVPSICPEIDPEPSTYTNIVRVKSDNKFCVAQEQSCYPMAYCTDKILALAWLDIEGLDEYPENGRMVFHFGDSYLHVEAELEKHEIFI